MEKKKGISGSTLKMIAIVTMLIDHIGAAVLALEMTLESAEKFTYWFAYRYGPNSSWIVTSIACVKRVE